MPIGKGQQNVEVALIEDTQALDEVVVVGFAKQKKANLTGSVSSVKMDEVMGDRPVPTTGALLQGAVPGLQVTSGSGEPGGGLILIFVVQRVSMKVSLLYLSIMSRSPVR